MAWRQTARDLVRWALTMAFGLAGLYCLRLAGLAAATPGGRLYAFGGGALVCLVLAVGVARWRLPRAK